jgi:hypothetical protein
MIYDQCTRNLTFGLTLRVEPIDIEQSTHRTRLRPTFSRNGTPVSNDCSGLLCTNGLIRAEFVARLMSKCRESGLILNLDVRDFPFRGYSPVYIVMKYRFVPEQWRPLITTVTVNASRIDVRERPICRISSAFSTVREIRIGPVREKQLLKWWEHDRLWWQLHRRNLTALNSHCPTFSHFTRQQCERYLTKVVSMAAKNDHVVSCVLHMKLGWINASDEMDIQGHAVVSPPSYFSAWLGLMYCTRMLSQ